MKTRRKFGRLTIVRYLSLDANHHRRVRCRCICGKTIVTTENHLKTGHTRSCGCLRREMAKRSVRVAQAKARSHGFCSHRRVAPEYRCFLSMHQRCENPCNPAYRYYGARGVRVCKRWSGRDGFVHFIQDMGRRKPGMTLGRILDGKLYSPATCEWESRAQQGAEARGHHAMVKLHKIHEQSKTVLRVQRHRLAA